MPIKKQKTDSETTPTAPKRIFDVSRPGALPPADPTGRPGIITNRVVLQDPMMVAQSSGLPAKDSSEDAPVKATPKLVIKPLSDQELEDPTKLKIHFDSDADGVIESDEATEAVTVKTTTVSTESGVAAEPKATAEPEPAAQTTSSVPTTTESSDDKDGEESPDSDINKLDKEAAALEADAKAQDEIDGMVNAKTYFLPINSIEQRRSRHVFIIGTIVILVLALLWLDIALDAGFITIPGIQPLTHIFTK